MRILLYLVFITLVASEVCISQVFNKAVDFSIGTPYLEPDGRNLSLKVSEEEFITLAKAKGGVMGPSTYALEKHKKDLTSVFRVSFTAEPEEDVFRMLLLSDKIRLFSVIHNSRTFVSQCKVYDYSLADGALVNTKIISEVTIKKWYAEPAKGAVEENFVGAISAAQPRGFVTPLEYTYYLQCSPDQKKFVLYIFDHAQKYLLAQTTIFDQELQVLSKGMVPIDNNFVNYGLHINNKGELFILNADRGGRIALIKYNMETKDNVFLDIASSSSKRYGFQLRFLNDDLVYVFNLSSRSEKFAGVMYSRFNFQDKLVDKINHHDLSEGMVQTSTVLRQNNRDYEPSDDWMYYTISDVVLNAYEKSIVVVEKRKIESTVFRYEASVSSHVDNWYEKSGKVIAGPIMLYSFNADDVLLWETYCLKNQSNDVSAGLLSASYAMTVTEEGKIRMLYASNANASGVYNEINYSEFEELSGSRIKNIKLDNKDGLSVLKDYTVWFDQSFVVGARKGLFGNKSFLARYSFE
jgi:hypothetical protein